ncbi:MULE transposase domain protein [Corynebacterium choanae]|uniref:MULE transposase domain protein n=2 Tax=Corynebacterium choanae TaxID=1862358 RepID=A0A3G6J5Q8_9CORY|nr:MULE transposase domain protein [Corynebacterium choanae]
MNEFISHLTSNKSIADIAAARGTSPKTVHRHFQPLWLISVPQPHNHPVYDQIFLDGTYLNGGCLLIAATRDYVLAWRWCKQETTYDYTQLIRDITPPLMAVIDGGNGAYTAMTSCWPQTPIQRCLVHVQRNTRRDITSRPRTPQGTIIYQLALQLTRITTREQADQWIDYLHQCKQDCNSWMNEKTTITDPLTGKKKKVFTHQRARRAFYRLYHLAKDGKLFAYLTPHPSAKNPEAFASTTNCLEGGINGPLKLIARQHHGRKGERQRTNIDWWLHFRTRDPLDPHIIAKQQNWGKDSLAKVETLTPVNNNEANHQTGRPALYDNHIDIEYTHSIGIRKGTI